ncbi:breast cancer type 1 susceptibility protein homolog isoform X2 [Nymphalis io]|uniref:breast cancer type 1 susceptibility protein homolog isoform X2 n=1 Tax=Inachis io TaxID=171585 RepID=UPI00216723E2|nr:breast cancer type 1 susceptibility protein homolog isoform X2 [Nymphalis io]
MIFKNLDINKLSRLSSQQVDYVTCIECCKYYVVPTTATCGHTLCHSCWRGRRTCPTCSVQVEKKNLKLNLPLQSLKDHVQLLAGAFEELFNIKYSQQSFIDQIQSIGQVTSNIQVHSEKKENPKSIGVVHVPPLQVDWDKIEEMPETEKNNKYEQNPVGPMDIEPFDFIEYDDKDYSTENPRRSSRNKENKNNHSNKVFNEITSEKNSGKDSNLDSENKTHKLGKNWNNVKRMKKEFSKLNKKNRNKLNVSIEMCKKTQTIANKAVAPNTQPNILYDIDDNTPQDNLNDKENSKYKNIIEEVTEEISTESNKQKNDDITYSHSNNSKHSNKAQGYINVKDKVTEDIPVTNKIDNVNNKTLESQKVCFFKKSALNKVETSGENKVDIEPNENLNAISVNNDDIEITIKIGNSLTNICIKKKDNDVQLKINSEREIQTSVENVNSHNNKNASCAPITENKSQNTNIIEDMQIDKVHDDAIIKCTASNIQIIEKSISIKKNTASADTATGNFEITESVEKELTDILDNAQCINDQNKKITSNNPICDNNGQTKFHQTRTPKVHQGIPEDMDYLNYLDIFDGESVKEGKVQSLKASKNTPSAILMPTAKSNLMKSVKDERKRELPCSDDNPITKKIKLTHESKNIVDKPMDTNEKDQLLDQDSENINYDAIMSQVFANIDADMGSIKKTKTTEHKQATQNPTSNHTKVGQPEDILHKTQDNNDIKHVDKEYANQKYSENVFSMIERDISDSEILVSSKTKTSTQINYQNEDPIKTAKTVNEDNIISDNIKSFSQTSDIEVVEIGTPLHNDDSDKSIVEETPQKSTPLSKNKSKNEITIVSNTQQLLVKDNKKPIKQLQITRSNVNRNPEDPVNVLSLSDTCDTTKTSKNVTVVETVQPGPTMETPLTITKFVDQIKHKSTPMARKSLNFNNQNAEDDAEQTLCPSSFVAAKTTQEKEFMQRAFDQTQNSSIQGLDTGKNCKPVKLCVGGSCLSSSEHANLKLLCLRRNWTFVDKYCKELTHLVVGVDEENKSQRSVKYMCALAGAKWIVSYEWVEKCLRSNSIVNEEPYEALDGTGEPGPRRSRVARLKLFEGITFYCMPPFTVLDVDTLKDILESAGGRVVNSPRDVRAAADPALLLAEPERTQDDKFMYLAMELSIVPVNYEWVLNCLGSYTLGSIYELLLCPASLLPNVTSNWPSELISRDYE